MRVAHIVLWRRGSMHHEATTVHLAEKEYSGEELRSDREGKGLAAFFKGENIPMKAVLKELPGCIVPYGNDRNPTWDSKLYSQDVSSVPGGFQKLADMLGVRLKVFEQVDGESLTPSFIVELEPTPGSRPVTRTPPASS